MKLNELLSKHLIVEDMPSGAKVEMPKLTTMTLDGVEYKFDGKDTWNGPDGKAASTNKSNKLKKMFTSMNSNQLMFDPADTKPIKVGDKFYVNTKEQSFSFTKEANAEKFRQRLKGGASIDSAVSKTQGIEKVDRKLWNRFKILQQMDADAIKAAAEKSPSLKAKLAKTAKGFGKILGPLGINLLLYNSFIVNYDTVANTPITDDFNETQKQELLDVITGLAVSQAIAAIVLSFRVLGVARVIKNIRTGVRAMQLGAAATGIGALPSVITMILTESLFWAVIAVLTSPKAQMALAEYIVGTWASGVFQTVGGLADGAANVLNTLTDGALGGETLRDALSFKKGVVAMPAGTAYASSEWAKLAFQDMIFPPDMEKILVPYTMPGARQGYIFEALDMQDPGGPVGDAEDADNLELDTTPPPLPDATLPNADTVPGPQ